MSLTELDQDLYNSDFEQTFKPVLCRSSYNVGLAGFMIACMNNTYYKYSDNSNGGGWQTLLEINREQFNLCV